MVVRRWIQVIKAGESTPSSHAILMENVILVQIGSHYRQQMSPPLHHREQQGPQKEMRVSKAVIGSSRPVLVGLSKEKHNYQRWLVDSCMEVGAQPWLTTVGHYAINC